ncbi:hypothetical protein AB205_0082710 [Aquarana catesbeiana]|uniref:Basement membrane-specific heparan sulfate proteoglycan core protein n=1 Tax=Aquarana catesbeiana TaxID=8400 RepID=A0A2G9RL49_AQUCT|nr:hypothetical protein AB205_0082710 [Aquarana catesbeiana]
MSPLSLLLRRVHLLSKDCGSGAVIVRSRDDYSNGMIAVRNAGTGTHPTAMIEPRQLTVQQGQPAEFRCTASGNPPPTVEWTGGQNGGIPYRASIQGGVLRFPSVQVSDEGQYTCIVRNSHGQHIARADLRVHIGGNLPVVQVSPERTEVREGDTVRLYCRAGGTPMATISWRKQGGILPPQARAERTDIATLVIPSISAADAGTYLCVGTNTAGTSEARIEVIVVRATGSAPLVRIEPSSDTLQEGQTVELNCVVASYPQAVVTWHRSDRPLSPNHQVYGSRLRILHASTTDSGEYICRVTNGFGTQQASIIITITPIYSENIPVLRIESSSGSLVEGQTLELDCQVSGFPGAEVTWYRPGVPLSPNHQVSGSRLRILQASAADSGEYICRVTVGTFTQQASTFVTVSRISVDRKYLHRISMFFVVVPLCNILQLTSSPTFSAASFVPVLKIEPSSSSVAEGQTLELNCVVSGQPNADVTWQRTGQPLAPNHQVLGSRLRIVQASVADSGEYICRVTSGGVTRQASITVTITHRMGPVISTGITPTIRVESPSDSLAEGKTVVLNCIVEGQTHQEVTWYRQGLPLSANHQKSGSRLRIVNASPRDSGEYICQVSGGSGIQAASIMVTIEGSHHMGVSTWYVTSCRNADLQRAEEEQRSGLYVLRSSGRTAGVQTFVYQSSSSVSLFVISYRRFDAGSGMATIRYPIPLSLGEFHTITLYRNLNQGSLVVDNQTPVNGTSQGKFQGLDLNEEIYLGGYPNYEVVSKTGLGKGFIGCVRQLILQGEEVIFKDLDLVTTGISNCRTCRDRPCKHEGESSPPQLLSHLKLAPLCGAPPALQHHLFTGIYRLKVFLPSYILCRKPSGLRMACMILIREGKSGSIQVDGEEVVSGSSPGKNIMVDTKASIYIGGAPEVQLTTAGKFLSGITGCIKNLVILNARPSDQLHQPIDLKHNAESGHNTKECPS